MQLVTNSVDSSSVREVTKNGTRYFIAEDVPFIRSRRLAGGYVPEDHVRSSAGAWDGVPLTLNHPRTPDDSIVSANTDIGESVTVGSAHDPRETEDGETGVKGTLRINADRAEELGEDGEALVDALEGGAGIEVSSQYFADNLPPGMYDGKRYGRVEGNLRPDSIALLPTKKGVCSLPDCGIAPDAGGDFGLATANTDRHLSVTAEPGDGWDDDTDPGLIRRGLAVLGMTAADPTEATANGEDADDCGCGCGGVCEDGGDDSNSTTPAETGTDESGNGNESPTPNQDTNTNMVDIPRDTIVESTAEKTGLDADTLGELDDDALTTLYSGSDGSAVQAGDADADPADEDGATANSGVDTEAIVDELKAYVDEQISANSEQAEKAELADQIVANSAEYDAEQRDELMQSPKSVLEGLRDSVTGSNAPGLPGTNGAAATANAAIGGDDDVDIEDFGTGVISND